MSRSRRRFTPEFKTQVVELLNAGKPVSEVAQEFGIGTNVLYRWKQASQVGSAGTRAAGEGSEANDLRRLQRENALLKQENDILKKAAIILGTRPQPSSGK